MRAPDEQGMLRQLSSTRSAKARMCLAFVHSPRLVRESIERLLAVVWHVDWHRKRISMISVT
jgi:hypothetical protein